MASPISARLGLPGHVLRQIGDETLERRILRQLTGRSTPEGVVERFGSRDALQALMTGFSFGTTRRSILRARGAHGKAHRAWDAPPSPLRVSRYWSVPVA